uniref:restriction endonuclease n=1 Tax=Pedobacter schmidteae TaxID=2201271 RepID=UPI000EB0B7DA|nr:restriction endonuclease [Pedobacter schmidteae]
MKSNHKNTLRIPTFKDEFLFNVYDKINVQIDEIDYNWIDPTWNPEVRSSTVGTRYDAIAHKELARMITFKTCPYCRTKMIELESHKQPGIVLACQHCLYWGGRGTRDWGGGTDNARGILGRCSVVENVDELTIFQTIEHFKNDSLDLVNMTPSRAEKLIPIILKRYLDCEVKVVGGVKDNGIDALIIRTDKSKMIVQIKWRSSVKGSESVSVVREVGGTLLARGIPAGMIISTRSKFSGPAKKEAELISNNIINGIGKLELELKDFNDIIDMLEVSHRKLSPNLTVEEIIPYYDKNTCLFG